MHIMEGFLPSPWWQLWTVAAAVCVIAGIGAFTRLVRRRPEALPLLGLAGAFVFILSSLKIPSSVLPVHLCLFFHHLKYRL